MAHSSSALPKPSLELMGSRQFTAWLFEQSVSLGFTTYQAGKFFLVGLQSNGRLSVFERTFERCMGLFAKDRTLYMSSLYQLWRFENVLEAGQMAAGYDALYVPQMSYITSDLDIHDIALTTTSCSLKSSLLGERLCQPGEIFVNTLFSCLAAPSHTHSFRPLWHPPFISKLAAEDRCHLNGLAIRDGQPAYVSAVSQSDVADGWREQRRVGGCIMDVRNNEVIATGLSMPHSPRWYQGKLWLLNSGTGEFGYVDLATGGFEPVTFCPGYLRGLAFIGDFAIVGLSQSRGNKTFAELPLEQRLQAKQVEPRCGLNVIDLRNGDMVHSLRIEGVVEELYDVVVLPQVRRPQAIGIRNDEIRRVLSVEGA
ncbi:MAG: TIGR03032 family protein [Cyanothece sp. SIO1E1]|nr:TIGR03032 family protein [Cyanothece sp. SIO1E1]